MKINEQLPLYEMVVVDYCSFTSTFTTDLSDHKNAIEHTLQGRIMKPKNCFMLVRGYYVARESEVGVKLINIL